MKKNILVAAALLSTTSAFALDYKFNLETRSDVVYDTMKTTAAGVTSKDQGLNFQLQALRLNMTGSVNENLTYRFRYRFNDSSIATTNRDASTERLDYAYIDHKNTWFTARLGKQNWAEATGRETILSLSDTFLKSQVVTDYDAAIGLYRVGATAMFTFAETNKLNIGLSNPNKTKADNTGVEKKNNGVAVTANYTGTFANRMFQPILAYTLAPQAADEDATAGSKSAKKNITAWNAGFRSEVAGFVIDADYKQFNVPNRNVTGTTTLVKTTTKSIWTQVAYTMDNITPWVQYLNDKFDSETATAKFKNNQFAVGVNYRPFQDLNFRYHLVYQNQNKKWDSASAATTQIKDNKFILGFKADI